MAPSNRTLLVVLGFILFGLLILSRPRFFQRLLVRTPAPTPALPIEKIENKNPFGVMLGNQVPDINARIRAATVLGSTYYRPLSLIVESWNGACSDCDAARSAGLKLALTVRNNGGTREPTSPPTDYPAFEKNLGQILDAEKPSLLVVENEENSKLFYSGTPAEYHRELASACRLAHARGIQCTNGGLVSTEVALLVANHYEVDERNPQKAQEFLHRVLSSDKYQEYQRLGTTTAPVLQASIQKGKELLEGYKTDGADVVNFHWYIADQQALSEAVSFLESASGLPAITNEWGQQQNENPDQIRNVMEKIVELKLPVAVEFSIDVNGFGGARGLVNTDGTLRPNGEAFQAFASQP